MRSHISHSTVRSIRICIGSITATSNHLKEPGSEAMFYMWYKDVSMSSRMAKVAAKQLVSRTLVN